MKRKIYDQLKQWKNNSRRKPLLLQGARQVGKTYLVTKFGQNEYSDFIYLNFEENPGLKTLFSNSLNSKTVLQNLSLYLGKKIDIVDTLIFFDEIQIAPKAITSLKYFFEQMPQLHIIAAGSLLGVKIGKKNSFPVGKVNFLNMYPMTFYEYLTAFESKLIAEELFFKNNLKKLPEILHNKLIDHFKTYLFLGGMPEVLQHYKDNKDIFIAREIQKEILNAYQRDFSKYSKASQAIKIADIWNSVPTQLAKENKKFKYSDVKKNARASTFEQSIEWLSSAGLVNLAYNVSVPKVPLNGYEDFSKFKVYLHDVGLLGAMLNLTSEIIIQPTKLFSEYNGAFIENFVASELKGLGLEKLYYWTSKSDAEVDFLLEIDNSIYPLEVKSGLSRNLKSLRSYEEKYSPKFILRTSPRNFTVDNNFINIPLYSVFSVMKTLISL